MNSRRYIKPTITRVDLRPEEAVLNGCKFYGGDPTHQLIGLSGCYESQKNPGEYYLCQQAGT